MLDDFAIEPARGAPRPDPDEHSAAFWAGLAERRIVVQICERCARHRFPRMSSCPYCGLRGGLDAEVSGGGTIYSFVRAHRALTAAYEEVAPYAIASIDLDGGVRMFGRVVPLEACRIGARVTPRFVDHDDWTELCFQVEP